MQWFAFSVLEADEEKAFTLFVKAANKGHVGGTFMVADSLMNGVCIL